jgi:hypothetical protein
VYARDLEANGDHRNIQVWGVLGAGPKAKRSPISFFQDGDYQEKAFRAIERDHPDVEHLGSWHTHHVNGLNTLSSGDLKTYHGTVNHEQHNTGFLLRSPCCAKDSSPRKAI